MGDNNIFTGKVVNCASDTNKELIQLEVEGIGSLFCRGYAVPVGTMAACSVRPDLMQLEPYSSTPSAKPSPSANHISARITAIELTGYVTRVSLMTEAMGQELLYKVRTTDWHTCSLQEGQLVTLRWSADDCVFLPE